jgi:hypothetical protein
MNQWTPYLPETDPLWPVWLIGGAALIVTLLTWLTYQGRELELRRQRVFTLWLLRMLALAVVLLLLLQPTWKRMDERKSPGKIVVLMDMSKSMTVQDEERNRSRWETAVSEWEAAAELIKTLEKEAVQIVPLAFDTRLRELRPKEPATGDGTALFGALKQTLERHRPTSGDSEKLLGFVVLTDGHDNVGQPLLDDVLSELAAVPCPVHTIGLGKPGGSEQNPDLVAEAIHAPNSARVKEVLSVRGTISAQQFDNQQVEVWLLLNGKEVDEAYFGEAARAPRKVRVVVRPTAPRQTIPIEFPPFKLPDVPGDYRLSLKIKPLPGELTETNNEVTTYISLSKEGLSVLFFDKLRLEPKYVRAALGSDERISVLNAYPSEDRGPEAVRWRTMMRDRIATGNFDVFIIGDLPASRFIGEGLLETLAEKVRAGAGLLMIGGQDSFGSGGWARTPLADLLPVDVAIAGQLEGGIGERKEIKFVPTDRGLEHFALRLDVDARLNREWWGRLPTLDGGNRPWSSPPRARRCSRCISRALAGSRLWPSIRPGAGSARGRRGAAAPSNRARSPSSARRTCASGASSSSGWPSKKRPARISASNWQSAGCRPARNRPCVCRPGRSTPAALATSRPRSKMPTSRCVWYGRAGPRSRWPWFPMVLAKKRAWGRSKTRMNPASMN